MIPLRGTAVVDPIESLKGLTTVTVWAHTLRGSISVATLTKQNKSRAVQCEKYVNAMATTEERKMFGPPSKGSPVVEEGVKKYVLAHLNDLLVARLAEAFKLTPNKVVPRELNRKHYELLANALLDRLAALKDQGCELRADSEDFTKFRKNFELEAAKGH